MIVRIFFKKNIKIYLRKWESFWSNISSNSTYL